MCDVKGGFGKALSKKGLGNIIVRMVLRAGRRVSCEQLKQDPRTTAYTGSRYVVGGVELGFCLCLDWY
jgi:hypothetical protein